MKNIVITILFFFLFFSIQAQTNYYVSPTGSDANNGSMANPWLTIQYGVDHIMAGDILNIMAGTYAGKIDINVSGAAGQVITIRNNATDQVFIDGSSLANYEYLLKIEQQNYITISGLIFQNYQKLDAIGIEVINSSHISIMNNEFLNIDYSPTAVGQVPNSSQNSQPIIVFGRDPLNPATDLLIQGNTIHDCEVGFSECISVNGNIDGFEVSDNLLYTNTNIPIVAIGHEGECSDPQFDQARNGVIRNNVVHDNPGAYAAAGGIYIDGAKNVIVENNTSYNNNYGIEVGCENNGNAPNDPSASNIAVRNNLLYNNTHTGILVGGYNYPTSGKVMDATISNNTCFNNDTGNNYFGEISVSYVENANIENNIFYTNNADKVLYIVASNPVNLAFDYNVFYTPAGANDIVIEINGTEYNTFSAYQAGTGQDAHSPFANPLFVNAVIPNPDLHIINSSPAVNAGNPGFSPAAGEVDMDSEARTSGIVDCGADENHAVLAVAYQSLFQAVLQNNRVLLRWSTASELKNDYFEVQRSTDTKYWQKVGFVIPARENPTLLNHYKVIDQNPLDGISYYRLKQVDLDGSFSYSAIETIERKGAFDFWVYPNSSTNEIVLQISQKIDATISIIDAMGHQVLFERLNGRNARFNINHLSSGLYFISVCGKRGDVLTKQVFFVNSI